MLSNIIPMAGSFPDSAIAIWSVQGIYFVLDLHIVRQRHRAMGKPGRNEQLFLIFSAKFNATLFAVSRAALPYIHGHIKNGAAGAAINWVWALEGSR